MKSLLITTISLLIIYMSVLVSAVMNIPVKKQEEVPAYFQKYVDNDSCEIIPTMRMNIRQHYGTVCYEGEGMWLEVGFGGMPDSIYAERVQPVKDSLAQNSGWW